MEKLRRFLRKRQLVLVIVFLMVILFFSFFQKNTKIEKKINLTQVYQMLEQSKIAKLEIQGNNVKIYPIEEQYLYTAILPDKNAFMLGIEKYIEKGTPVEEKKSNIVWALLIFLMKIMLPIIMVLYFFGRFSQKQYGFLNGNKVRIQKSNIKLTHVAGLSGEIAEIRDVLNFLKEPQKFEKMGASIPKGILLYGEPGTGKTLIAKAIAGEANASFIPISGSEFETGIVGGGAKTIKETFRLAKANIPAIIFIDEIDCMRAKQDEERTDTLGQLLTEMDGFEEREGVIIIAATNNIQNIDQAILRPGRFDRKIYIPLPDLIDREEILKLHAANKKMSKEINWREIAKQCTGFSGAELANVLNEASIIAVNKKCTSIGKTEIEEAIRKVMMGIEDSRMVSGETREICAYHEAGHALITYLCGKSVIEVSIIPRGLAGGYTMQEEEENAIYTKEDLTKKISILLGGRAAESVACHTMTTGAKNDIEKATQIVTDMVTCYGMSEEIGPMYYEEETFYRVAGDIVDQTVRKLLKSYEKEVKEQLQNNKEFLEKITKELLDKEKLTEQEFQRIVS